MRKSLVLAAVVVAGCASQPGPLLPYHFSVASVTDAREAPGKGGSDPIYDVMPFDGQAIAASFASHLVSTPYSAREGKIYLKVTHYRSTTGDTGAAFSMGVEGYALDDSPRPRKVGAFKGTCSEVRQSHFPVEDFSSKTVEQKSMGALTPRGWAETLGEGMLNGCTRELARQFASSLAKGE